MSRSRAMLVATARAEAASLPLTGRWRDDIRLFGPPSPDVGGERQVPAAYEPRAGVRACPAKKWVDRGDSDASYELPLPFFGEPSSRATRGTPPRIQPSGADACWPARSLTIQFASFSYGAHRLLRQGSSAPIRRRVRNNRHDTCC